MLLGWLSVYKNMIAVGVVVALIGGLYFYVHGLKVQIAGLRSDLKDSQLDVANSRLEVVRFKRMTDKQSDMIKAMEVDRVAKIAELSEWKSKKPEVRYKVITKIREVKSDECSDVENVLDAVRTVQYGDL